MLWADIEQKNVGMAIARDLIGGIAYPQAGNWRRLPCIYPPEERICAKVLLYRLRQMSKALLRVQLLVGTLHKFDEQRPI